MIYKNGDGYSYSQPEIGDVDMVVIIPPGGVEVVGDIHSHGAYDGKYQNEDFSPSDIEGNDNSGTMGYLVTPGGKLIEYNPKTKRKRIITPNMPRDPDFPKEIKE